MAGRHERAPDPAAPSAPARGVDRRLILAGALLILAALVAFALFQFHILGGKSTPSADTSVRPTATKTKSASPTATASASGSVKPPASPTPASPVPATTSTKPEPTSTAPTSTAPATPTPGAVKGGGTQSGPAAAPKVPLLVLNNSSVTGLGTAAGSDFAAGGWTIAGVGNLTGRIKDTTVYYAPGYESSGRALAEQFPQLHRVLARIDGLPGTAKLTVVITRYYEPGGGK